MASIQTDLDRVSPTSAPASAQSSRVGQADENGFVTVRLSLARVALIALVAAVALAALAKLLMS